MKTISLKINDLIFEETEKILSKNKKPINRYINEALKYYNQVQKQMLLEKTLKKESELVKVESISILKDFKQGG